MIVEYGLLTGIDPDLIAARWRGHEDKVKVNRARELWSWSQSRKVNLLAVAIQFSTRDTRIASTLVGAATPAEIEVDVNAFLERLPDDTWSDLNERFGI
jgi:D-threo-aldose 1-dehydrogenase